MATEADGQIKDERDARISPEMQEINELIRKAQNKNGSISRTTRDDAIMELTRKFKGLIESTARKVHRTFSQITLDEFIHDATTEFIILLIEDYCLKEDGGSAFFGHYVKQKLYYRMLDKSQKSVRHYDRTGIFDPYLAQFFETDGRNTRGRHHTISHDPLLPSNSSIEDIGISDEGITRRAVITTTPTDVLGAVNSNFRYASADEPVYNDEHRREVLAEYTNIVAIARRLFTEREFFIFSAYFASGLVAREIEAQLDPPIPYRRIPGIANGLRDRVLIELGRQRVKRTIE